MKRPPVFLLMVLWLAATLPGPASASYDEVGSGQTKLRLDTALLAQLKRDGVKILTRAPAHFRGGVVTFPAGGGKFDPTAGKATIDHEGALILKAKKGALSLKRLQLKSTRRSAPLAARLGGGQLKLGTTSHLAASRRGFGETFQISTLRLSAKVAARLNKRLQLRSPVRAGQPLAAATSTVQPLAVSVLDRGRASLELAPPFAAKLDQLHVAVTPIFPGEHPGAFTFAISGGRIAPDLKQGTLLLQGGMEFLQLGGGQAIWSAASIDLDSSLLVPEVDLEPAPPYAGKLGPSPVAGLELLPGQAEADPRLRRIAMKQTPLLLSATTAARFNEIFAKPQGRDGVFAAGEPLGLLSFSAQGQ